MRGGASFRYSSIAVHSPRANVPSLQASDLGRATLARALTLPRRGVTSRAGRPDILVAAEEVRRVVLVLQRHQAVVARAIGRLDPRLALLACFEVVDVAPA